jgi:hypothetical protein
MGFALPASVVNSSSAFFYANVSALGTLVKEPTDQTLVVVDYSQVDPAVVVTSVDFSVDVSSNPSLIISYPVVDSTGLVVTFLLSGGIAGQQYNIAMLAHLVSGTRTNTLKVNVPTFAGSVQPPINPVPAIYTQLPLSTDGFINTALRYFWGAAPPNAPSVLDQWYNTTTETLFEWATDGTSFFWEMIASVNIVMEAPSSGVIYGRYNGHWVPDVIQSDAPANSQLYSRSNNGWVVIPLSTDASSDGHIYGRKNGAWTVVPPAVITSDAPSDGTQYARLNAAWSPIAAPVIATDAPNDGNVYLRGGGVWRTGGTLAGSLTIGGNLVSTGNMNVGTNLAVTGVATFNAQVALAYDPIQPLQAATKQYVDNQIASGLGGSTVFVRTAGSTMTGPLVLSGNPSVDTQAANKGYVDSTVATATAGGPFLPLVGGTLTGDLTVDGTTILSADPTNPFGAATKHYVDINSTGGIGDAPFTGDVYGRANGFWVMSVPLAGGVMTGTLVLSGDPTASMQAATKNYVDTSISTAVAAAPYLPLGGGTLTGPLTLVGNPSTGLGAATKNYVDTKIGTAVPLMDGIGAPGSATLFSAQDHIHPSDTSKLSLSGGTMTGLVILSGNPTATFGATTKTYVDGAIGSAVASYLLLAGGTLTGSLNIATTNPTLTLNKAGSGNNNTIAAQTAGGLRWNVMLGNSALESGSNNGSDFTITAIADDGTTTIGTALNIKRSTGLITLAGNPTATLGAATKGYVDSGDALKLSLTGGTLTGPLILAADPTVALGTATKQYVDNNLAAPTSTVLDMGTF